MPSQPKPHPARRRHAALLIAALAGLGAAVLVMVAGARTFTLQVAKSAKVTNTVGATTRENIVVNLRGRAVYDLSGDSRRHPECTKAKGCFQFWPPVTVSSPKKLSKAPGVLGRLRVWHRDGFFQVTLAGHPLYTFAGDSRRHVATGEGLRSFGGTWHVIRALGASSPGAATTSTSTSTSATTTTSGTTTSATTSTGTTTSTSPMTTTTTTTAPCLYPPCY